jgi:NAD(P)-dependent dehydrogenase (short-subunit alcohol dehydrogenase family)
MSREWTPDRMPDQTGRTALVTGAGSGLGLVVAAALARRGARVLMAVRDTARGEQARAELRAAEPRAELEVRHLDLLDLDSVRAFAETVDEKIDVLVNNAGIATQPHRLSPQGHESHFATNHLGHFALTGLLLPVLAKGDEPRVVTVSSTMYAHGNPDFATPRARHSPTRAYADSKLANALFGLELHRRLDAARSPIRSLVAHPGMARTPLHGTNPSRSQTLFFKAIALVIGRPAHLGALPLLYAATAPDVPDATFIGPTTRKGTPTSEPFRPVATDPDNARALWTLSERLTDVRYDIP